MCDAISGARPGARREVVESYIKRLKEMEEIALSYPRRAEDLCHSGGPRAARDRRQPINSPTRRPKDLSRDIAKKIQDEMTYPGQVKITVIRETRAVAYAK